MKKISSYFVFIALLVTSSVLGDDCDGKKKESSCTIDDMSCTVKGPGVISCGGACPTEYPWKSHSPGWSNYCYKSDSNKTGYDHCVEQNSGNANNCSPEKLCSNTDLKHGDICSVNGFSCTVANPGSALQCDGGCPSSFAATGCGYCYTDLKSCEEQCGKNKCDVAQGGLCAPSAPGSKVCKGACTKESPYKGCGWCYPTLDECHTQCGKDKCYLVGVSACECKGDGTPNYPIAGFGDYKYACTATSDCSVGCTAGLYGYYLDGGYKIYTCD